MAEAEKKELARLFKSHLPSNTMLLESGKPCIFRAGRYATDKPEEIEFFEKEIAAGNPFIFVDKDEPEVVPQESVLDMMERLKKEGYEQAMKDLAGGKGDAGSSDRSAGAGAGIATSDKLAALAANAGATITPATK